MKWMKTVDQLSPNVATLQRQGTSLKVTVAGTPGDIDALIADLNSPGYAAFDTYWRGWTGAVAQSLQGERLDEHSAHQAYTAWRRALDGGPNAD